MPKGDKYKKLTQYLIDSNRDRIVLTFEQVKQIAGSIPNCSYKYTAAWSDKSQHSFSFGWLKAGYSAKGDLEKQIVIFTKTNNEVIIPLDSEKIEENFEKSENKIIAQENHIPLDLFSRNLEDYKEFDINIVLNHLRKKRFAFQSEADFQFQLAWAIKEIYLDRVELILEYPTIINEHKAFIDIVVILDKDKIIPIELKYKTKKAYIKFGNLEINLKNQGAQDLGKFDYLSDIERIESFNHEKFYEGYAIMITNDFSYTKKTNGVTKNMEFSIGNCCIKNGVMTWGEGSSIYNNLHRKASICFKKDYKMNWKIYGTCKDIENKEINFYIIVNKITK